MSVPNYRALQVDLHFNVQSLALIDSNLDTNVRRAIIRYADDLYLKHVQKLCEISNENLGGQDMLKAAEFEMSKENPRPPLDTFRQVLLANNRFHTVLPKILYDAVKANFKKTNEKKRQTRGIAKPKSHKCPVCQRMFGLAWRMNRHMNMMHSKEEIKE